MLKTIRERARSVGALVVLGLMLGPTLLAPLTAHAHDDHWRDDGPGATRDDRGRDGWGGESGDDAAVQGDATDGGSAVYGVADAAGAPDETGAGADGGTEFGAGTVDEAVVADDGGAAPISGTVAEDGIIAIIYEAADRYGQPREDMLRVAMCESNLDASTVGAFGELGIFQFMPSTWATTPYADLDPTDPWAAANATGWMWSVGRRGEWVCQ